MNMTEVHSYSSINKFETCPNQFAEVRFYKNYKESFSGKAAVAGSEMHKTLELAFKFKERDCEDSRLNEAMRQVWCNLDKLKFKGSVKIEPEVALGVQNDLITPCEFFCDYPDGGFRGKIDLLAMAAEVAYIVDWKTGNPNYASLDQLEMMAYLVSRHFPHIKKAFVQLVFVHDLDVCKDAVIDLSEQWQEEFRSKMLRKIGRIEKAKENDDFFAQPNGLCKNYCVVDSCPHNGRYTGS